MSFRSIFGEEIPPSRIHRRLETSFLTGSVPNWLSVLGDGSAAMQDLATSRGDYQVTTPSDGGESGIAAPTVALQHAAEVRFGTALSAPMADGDQFRLGVSNDPLGTGDSAEQSVVLSQASDGDRGTLTRTVGGEPTTSAVNWAFDVSADAGIVAELRLNPGAGAITVVVGDQIVYHETGVEYAVTGLTPFASIDTTASGSQATASISECWFDVYPRPSALSEQIPGDSSSGPGSGGGSVAPGETVASFDGSDPLAAWGRNTDAFEAVSSGYSGSGIRQTAATSGGDVFMSLDSEPTLRDGRQYSIRVDTSEGGIAGLATNIAANTNGDDVYAHSLNLDNNTINTLKFVDGSYQQAYADGFSTSLSGFAELLVTLNGSSIDLELNDDSGTTITSQTSSDGEISGGIIGVFSNIPATVDEIVRVQ